MASPSETADPTISPSDFSTTRFDYLIAGGGTVGLVVAARLSDNPDIRVGVLEAGPSALDDPLINVPGRWGESIGGHLDWKFETAPQAGLNGRRLAWPRGRVLGGTSALNFMTWARGNREDYDAWEELGNEGWGWDGMLPHFRKTETLHPSTLEHQSLHNTHHDAAEHGTSGPISTSYSPAYSVPHAYWHSTLQNLGVDTNGSHFSGSNVGAFTTLTSVEPDSQTRSYAASAYFLPIAHRKNLHVLTDATVQKVVLEQKDGEWVATGVEYTSTLNEDQNKVFIAHVSREVILSAGSIQSPQLLELSGIGNPDILAAAGVEVKVENKNVGENLQDHMMTATVYELTPSIPPTPHDILHDPILKSQAEQQYTTHKTGPYTLLPCSLAYIPLSTILPTPTLQTLLSDLPPPETHRDEILHKQFTQPNRGQIEYIFDTGSWHPSFTPVAGKRYGTMLSMLQLPLSRGNIHIAPSSSPSQTPTPASKHPHIDPKYLEGPGGEIDKQLLSHALDYGDLITSTAPLSTLILRRVFPPPHSTIEETLLSDYHPIGTCAISPHPSTGVVDPRLRVHGVKGLRVVDASVMPLHVCSHPQATIYAIGEKGAGMLLEDWVVGV